MELKSLKKKYKSKGFAAGCSREVIERGAEQLGWELEKLLTMTLAAMAASEDYINEEMEKKMFKTPKECYDYIVKMNWKRRLSGR